MNRLHVSDQMIIDALNARDAGKSTRGQGSRGSMGAAIEAAIRTWAKDRGMDKLLEIIEDLREDSERLQPARPLRRPKWINPDEDPGTDDMWKDHAHAWVRYGYALAMRDIVHRLGDVKLDG